MGNLLNRHLGKPFRSFNVENRAQRVIAKEKPVPSPRYDTAAPSLPESVQSESTRVLFKLFSKALADTVGASNNRFSQASESHVMHFPALERNFCDNIFHSYHCRRDPFENFVEE